MVTVDPKPRTRRIMVYAVLGSIVGLTIIIAVAFHRTNKENTEASQKASQVRTAFASAGLPQPKQENVIRLLGTDGGIFCAAPNNALVRANLLAGIANGAGGPGVRPIYADEETWGRVVRGQTIIISVYCPDELQEWQNFVDKVEFAKG